MKSNTEKDSIRCLLCSFKDHEFFFKDKFRAYRRCNVCSIIFVPKEFHVSKDDEKARYEEHNNDSDDIRYRDFLERITIPIKSRFTKGAKGLDFGCGSTNLLANVFKESGFEMEVYDPFYEMDRSVLDKKYDFIVSTEVIEHLSDPLPEFEKLFAMLKANGVLGVMTRLYDDSIDFKTWHYKNDRTHIGFYSIETFDWLTKKIGVTYSQIESDIFVFENRKI
ncbi:MAG: class I SAM-dependent methyltransferase [Aridibacter sp.]